MSAAPPVHKSLQEYGRGVAGGLLFSLPMLYTMEVWWAGFQTAPLHLLGYVGVSFVLLLGYNRFAGMRRDATFLEVGIDSIEEMGLGLVLSAIILYLLGRISAATPLAEVVGKVVVEAMTVAIGVSVGTAQLGGSNGDDDEANGGAGQDKDGEADAERAPSTGGQLVLAFCGAVLFAANVAPTEEIMVIAIETSTAKLLGLVVLSLLLGALILFQADFIGTDRHVRRDGCFWVAFGLVTSYAAAILASALMLWFFHGFSGVSPQVAVSQVVVLGFPAMLGASAGRLLIQ